MSAEDLNLSDLRSLDATLGRLKNGRSAVRLAGKLGLWSDELHASDARRAAFPRRLSDLSPPQLSDLYAEWTAEFGRVLELNGALDAQSSLLRMQIRSAEAAARARLRRSAPDKSPTQQALADMAAEDPAVRDLSDEAALVAVLEAHARAAKEATAQYLATISREIAFRDAQMKARVY